MCYVQRLGNKIKKVKRSPTKLVKPLLSKNVVVTVDTFYFALASPESNKPEELQACLSLTKRQM